MKIDKTMVGILAGISLFIGFVIISVAVGAVFPSMHKLTAPLICKGEVQVESIRYSYKPGQVGWDNHIYCIDEQGSEKEITFPAIGVTGLFYSAILFVILLVLGRRAVVSPETFGELAADIKPGKAAAFPSARRKVGTRLERKEGTRLERLAELKQMWEAKLITREEYEKKKARIMDEI
jgi:hypothetical protein